MQARALLLALESCEKGKPLRLPLIIQPDFYFPMHKESSNFFLKRLRERIEELNPPYIEVTHWEQLAQIHFIDLEAGFDKGMKFLFSLPVSHLHFTFDYLGEGDRLVDRATHFLTQVCGDHIKDKKALPVFTYHCRDLKGRERCHTVFNQIMTSAGHSAEDVVDARAALYIAKGEISEALMVYQQALQDFENPGKILLKRGLRLEKLGLLDYALDDFMRVIALENANTVQDVQLLDSAYYHAAVAYWKLEKNVQKSLSFLNRISPTYQLRDDVENEKSSLAKRILKQGLKLYSDRKIKEALETFNLGLHYLPDSTRLRHARGELYRQYHALPVIQKIANVTSIEDVLDLAIVDFETILGSGKNKKAKEGLKACEKDKEILREKREEAAMDAAERRRERKPHKSPRHQNGLFTSASLPSDASALSFIESDKRPFDGARI